MSKLIPLRGKHGKGKFAIVDDADFDWLNQYKWYLDSMGYACRNRHVEDEPGKRRMAMHHVIHPLKPGFVTDHIDRNPLNNQRANLRDATRAQNVANSKVQANRSSRYKGVTWFKRDQKWRAQIGIASKTISIGYYASEEEAARARDIYSLFYHGEFAVLNFPL